MIAFAGEYHNNKKSRGLYILLKSDEAFMFQGLFNEDQRTGVKVKIGIDENTYEKCWGSFNSSFEFNGKGESLVYAHK
jgi:hypothetical protein